MFHFKILQKYLMKIHVGIAQDVQDAHCWKITQKVSFYNIASESSYVCFPIRYIFSAKIQIFSSDSFYKMKFQITFKKRKPNFCAKNQHLKAIIEIDLDDATF